MAQSRKHKGRKTTIEKINNGVVPGNGMESANGRKKINLGGQPWAVIESRCKVCKNPNARKLVDSLSVSGYNMAEVFRQVDRTFNGDMPKNQRINYSSVRIHIQQHLSVEDAAVRKVLERRAIEQDMAQEEGINNIVNPLSYAETMLLKAQELLSDNKMVLTAQDGLSAAKAVQEFEKLNKQDESISNAIGQVDKIMEAVKMVCTDDQLSKIAALLRGEAIQHDVSSGEITSGGHDNIVDADLVDDDIEEPVGTAPTPSTFVQSVADTAPELDNPFDLEDGDPWDDE